MGAKPVKSFSELKKNRTKQNKKQKNNHNKQKSINVYITEYIITSLVLLCGKEIFRNIKTTSIFQFHTDK